VAIEGPLSDYRCGGSTGLAGAHLFPVSFAVECEHLKGRNYKQQLLDSEIICAILPLVLYLEYAMSVKPMIQTKIPVFFALLILLAVTRGGHFGSAISLPDASLAVFLLGGAWLNGMIYFGIYAAMAFGIDVTLAKTATAAGWCLTPAYGGLIIAYGAVWLLGHLLARTPEWPVTRYITLTVIAVAVHFMVANASFWAYSGYFAQMTAADYAQSVMKYFPPYLASTALYMALAWIAHYAVTTRLTPAKSLG
jgi:hypothetical protein